MTPDSEYTECEYCGTPYPDADLRVCETPVGACLLVCEHCYVEHGNRDPVPSYDRLREVRGP